MNKKENSRSQQTKIKIRQALMDLLKCKNLNEIYVRDICTMAQINRSSFYEHYQDINDLMMHIEADLSQHIAGFFVNIPHVSQQSFVQMFEFIQNNAEFYHAFLVNRAGSLMDVIDFKSYIPKMLENPNLQTTFSQDEIVYHMAFFAAGLSALCKAWLLNDMQETPAQMAKILSNEYAGKQNQWLCIE